MSYIHVHVAYLYMYGPALLLLCIETLDSAASIFHFNTVGIKEIVGQGGQGNAVPSHRLRSR